MTVAPDLVFGYGAAIGDIRYKLAEQDWRRCDLYEVVAFATAAGADRAALVEFARGSDVLPPPLALGSMSVRHFAWDADVEPHEAAGQLLSRSTVG